MNTRRGTLIGFDSGTWTAVVLLAGSLSVPVTVTVARNIESGDMVAGRRVAVSYFDDSNPGDAVLFAVWT